MKTRILYSILFVAFAVILTGCATQPEVHQTEYPGFLHGLFHGFIILFSFVISLFTDYEIYAFPNNGGWYNFGFLLGVMMFFGGGGAGSRRRKR